MASDYFLKLTDIEGESQDSKHTNEIDIDQFFWGATQPGSSSTGGGSGGGKVQIHDFLFVAKHSQASPKLMLACADGAHVGTATFTIRKAGTDQQEYSIYTLSNAIVSDYHVESPKDGSSIPVDRFKLNFSKIEHQYKVQKSDGTLGGSVKTGWDVKANKSA